MRLTVFAVLVWVGAFCNGFLGETIDRGLFVEYSYYQGDWHMGLSDGSCWKMLPMKERRKQTWNEWWKGKQPDEWDLGSEFFFDPHNWKGKFEVQVSRAAQSVAAGYDYVLTNASTGERAFAMFVQNGAQYIPKLEYTQGLINRSTYRNSHVVGVYPFLDDLVVCQDDSVWQLFYFGENSRSFSEWWNGVKIDQPDPIFLTTMKDWASHDQVVIYEAQIDNRHLAQKYKVNKPIYNIFMLHNKTKNKLVYARPVALKETLSAFQSHAEAEWQKGYNRGHNEGYRQGYSIGKQSGYQSGFTDGEKRGYARGYRAGHIDAENGINNPPIPAG